MAEAVQSTGIERKAVAVPGAGVAGRAAAAFSTLRHVRSR